MASRRAFRRLRWLAVPLLVVASVAAIRFEANGATQAAAANLTRYVDPLIGTDIGGTTPAAAVPFGMVQLGPDTPDHRYHYPDSTIADFSATHMSGAGCNNKGDVQFLPFVGAIGASPGPNWASYQPPLSHATESAAPGFYGVTLPNSGTKVELTATTRTGFTRLTYPSSTQATVLFNASRNNSYSDRGGQLSIVGDHQITGVFNGGGTCSNEQVYALHYTISFDRPFTGFGTWLGGSVSRGSRSTDGHESGGFVTFDTTGNRTVKMKVALSYVSLAGAQQAMATENPGWSFDTVRAAADTAWNNQLHSIEVSGGTTDDLKKFYTALYHTFYTPNVTSDRNGDYLGFDNAKHNAGSRVIYQNYSGWDVYRSWIQLVSALAPQGSDIAQSMVLDGQQGVALPMWSDANKELRVMAGDPGTIMVSDAYAFGARNFDTATALRLMDQSSDDPTHSLRNGIEDWRTLHYHVDNAAETEEYAAADFALAQFANALGDTAKFQKYSARGQYWKNTFNPGTRYIQARHRDGSWMQPWSPTTTDGYVEGNGAIYTWAVPWNLKALFELMGGTSAAAPRLDAFFSELSGGQDKPYLDIGNEPSFSQPWVYNAVRQPWKTQDVVDRIITQKFHTAPAGYPGDDDLGAMSSWLVWAYLGMYPMIPGTDIMALSTPHFPSVRIHLASGRTVQINAPGAGTDSHYIQSLSVNGSPTQHTWLRFGILSGATLAVTTGASPNTSWGSAAGNEPPSFDADDAGSGGGGSPPRTGNVVRRQR
jgi:predicted alpha-1,2-mannosidase